MGIKQHAWRIRSQNGNPCRPGCTRRSVTCHTTCKEYADFVELRKAEADKRLLAIQSMRLFRPKK